jgi:hypothetical protein
VTRNWRLESYALLALWAAASALLLFVARIPHRPVLLPSFARPRTLPSSPARRPPVARPHAARTATGSAAPEVEVDEAPGGERPEDAARGSAVEVVELEGIDILGYGGGDFDGYESDLDYTRWEYRSHFAHARWNRSWRFRRGLALRPASSAFFADGSALPGASEDPCAVFPGACSAARDGGAFAPAPATVTRTAVLAHREYGSPATVTRDGDLWRLGNGQITIDVNALCLMTSRRIDDTTPSVASFSPPVETPCVVRETAVPWGDREGAAIEMSWSAPGGSMRAVVALADDGASAEASVARTDASGETWLANMGTTSLTWTIAGSPVTVAPGGAVRVSAKRSAGVRA